MNNDKMPKRFPPFRHSGRPHGFGPPRGEPPFPVPKEIESSIAFLLVRSTHRALEYAENSVKHLGLELHHVPLLLFLEAQGPQSQTALTKLTNIDRTTMVFMIDELEGMGLIERQKDPSDRRAHLVTFTPKGLEVLGHVKQSTASADVALLKPLSAEEQEVLRGMLRRLTAS